MNLQYFKYIKIYIHIIFIKYKNKIRDNKLLNSDLLNYDSIFNNLDKLSYIKCYLG